MKDKQLLTEINRIKEIMGVRLLTEQSQVFDNILTSLVKLSKGGLKSKITKLISKPNISGAEFRNLVDEIKTMKGVDSGLITLINKFEKSIIDKASSTKYSNHITKRLKEGATESEITNELLSHLNTVYGDFINAKILDDFKLKLSKRIDTIQQKINPPKPTPPKPEENFSKEIKNINWNNIPQISDDTAKKLFITNRTLWDKVKNFITPSKAILNGKVEKIKLLSKRYTETNDTNLKSDIQDELKKELYSLGIESKKMMKSTNQFLNEVISKFERDIRGNIINPGEKMFSEYIGKIQSDTKDFTNIGKLLQFTPEGNQFLMVLKDAFNSAIKPAKVIQSIRNRGKSAREITLQMFGKETENISDEMLKKIEQNHESAINWFKSGSPRGNPWYPKYQQNYEDIISKSGLSAAKKSYLMELVIRLIKFKIIWGSLYIIRDYLTYYVKRMDDKTEELLNKCLLDKKNKVKDSQYCSKLTSTHFGEWMLTVATVLQEKDGWEAFADIALKEYLPIIEGSFGDEITDWWPGYYDDLGIFIFNSVKFIFNKENIDKSLEDVDELMREKQDEIDNVQTQIDTTLSQNNVNLSPPQPVEEVYTNDPKGFKKYIKNTFEDDNPVISGTKDSFTYEDIEFKYNNGKFD